MESVEIRSKINEVKKFFKRNKLLTVGVGLITLGEIKDIIMSTHPNISLTELTGIKMFDATTFCGMPVGHIAGDFFSIFTVGTIAVAIARALVEIKKHPENVFYIIVTETVSVILLIVGLNFLLSFASSMIQDAISIGKSI